MDYNTERKATTIVSADSCDEGIARPRNRNQIFYCNFPLDFFHIDNFVNDRTIKVTLCGISCGRLSLAVSIHRVDFNGRMVFIGSCCALCLRQSIQPSAYVCN